jgi:hypothetical protein
MLPNVLRLRIAAALPALLLLGALARPACAADKPAKSPATPDTLVLKDGNTLRGTLVMEAGGAVTFHTPSLGDINVPWAQVQELHATESFAVLTPHMNVLRRKAAAHLPIGPLDATSESVTVRQAAEQPAPIPTKDAAYIVSQAMLDQQLYHAPGFFQGWNGSATAGAALVSATQNQYTFSGALALSRAVPTASWLATRERTSADFAGSFGKITQPAYVSPTGPVAALTTKTAILHFGAERDEYLSPRFFALGQTAFDHNYSQDLNLQQIYGGGMGWTVLQTPKQQADLKATIQYEKQDFIAGSGSTNQNLIGSTFSAAYMMKTKLVTWSQALAYIPAWNNSAAYSANETDTFAFPAYRNFSFSLGTMDSYLNDSPATLPPTKPNSFQFTMGLTYAIKSKY